MDWDYPINKFFELSKEEQEEVITALTKHYYHNFVQKENEDVFIHSIDTLIFNLHREELRAINDENFERAEICNKLIINLVQIQDNYGRL